MADNPFSKYAKKPVVIVAGGTTYRGILIEASADEVLLKSETGWVSVRMDRIVSVRSPNEAVDSSQANSHIDSSFYDFDPSE